MPSPRRMRLLMMAAVVTVVFLFFYSGRMDPENAARTRDDFYSKTKQAMDGKQPPGQAVLDSQTGQKAGHIPADKDADGDVDADDDAASLQMQERLKAAEQEAKDKANEKGGLRPDPPSNIVGVGSSADGQKKDKLGKSGSGSDDTAASKDKKVEKTKEEQKAEVELKAILKKSPVIIFSKSYCPYSKRAKGLLLEKYLITPDPYVVELDEHPLGPSLQDELLQTTGRRTVPNVMINGVSIGGADDIVALDNDDDLVAKILELGNKRVDIVERFVSGNKAT
ncbi:Fc.00g067810.m01.CDS01 [Cosmosporella sp. VM-42]